ncbi:MAG: type III secretion system outer membrane ring subunit SctC [Rhizobacter sp.]
MIEPLHRPPENQAMTYFPRHLKHLCLIVLLSTTASLAMLNSALANAVPWQGEKMFRYNAQNKPIKEMLRDLATSHGVTAVIDAEIEATVNGTFNLTPQSMLDLLAVKNGLVWYFDGTVLHIQRAESSVTEIVRLRGGNSSRVLNGLTDLNVVDRRFPITYDNRKNVLKVTGPKPYVDIIRDSVRALDDPSSASQDAVIKVFPLKFAWAADNDVTLNGKTVRIPGVVKLLNDLFPSEQPTATAPEGEPQPQAVKRKKLKSGLVIPIPNEPLVDPLSADPRGASGNAPNPARRPGLPQIVADQMNNAVIIRDTPERMAAYEPLIARLDIRPRVLEIEARIIEVNNDALENIGVDWRLRTSKADIQSNNQPRPLLTPGAALDEAISSTGTALTTVLKDSGRFFIARVSLLENQGKAKTVSTPKIIALDNMEAVIQRRSTFYIRVAGNQDAAVFDVPVDTSLRVTPRFVALDGDGKNLIRMSIRIDDGVITTRSVDTLPVTDTISISTQAMIEEGQSLLIGGLSQEISGKNRSGIPLLSKIPGLGQLFRNDTESFSKVERLFLLTPRLVILGGPRPVEPEGPALNKRVLPPPASTTPAPRAYEAPSSNTFDELYKS